MQNPHNKIKVMALSLALVIGNVQISYSGCGKRKHFLSHGPSVAAFGAGESVFSSGRDPAVMQYNPSLIAFFSKNAVSLSRFNLFEGTSYNSCSAVVELGKKIFLGISASNLSSGNIEIRETIYSPEKNISVNTWECLLSAAGFIDEYNVAYGLNFKYLYYDLYSKKDGTYVIDGGISKNVQVGDILRVKLGLSAQNFVSGKLVLDSNKDDLPKICRLSSAFILPLYYRLNSEDTINAYADLKYEDGFVDFCGGLAYIIADKYVLSAGYYPEHITCGIGLDFYYFTIDYSADFNKIDLINRFSLTYRWQLKNTAGLEKEAQNALNEERVNLKTAEQKFKEAKGLYNAKEYLRATDMLSNIIMSYSNYESPKHFYNEIRNMMKKDSEGNGELDFEKLTYAKAYVAYYNADYKEALNEWKRYISFIGKATEEIKEYSNKIDTALKLTELEQREKELERQAGDIFEEGLIKYNSGKFMQCIKQMEKLESFVSINKFSKTLEYYNKAKEYIDKSVSELLKSVSRSKNKTVKSKGAEEKNEDGEMIADKKYTEGLILYAQGKYYEAERAWELTLRLNPRHQKAKVALRKLKMNHNNAGE